MGPSTFNRFHLSSWLKPDRLARKALCLHKWTVARLSKVESFRKSIVADQARMVAKVNLSHTVGDLRNYITA